VDTRRIGSLDVTVVGLGCNNFGRRVDLEGTRRVVDAALEAGINFFDTADIYGATRSEEFLGRVLEGRRERVVLATKFGMKVDDARSGAKPDYVRRACEDSLRRLRTDCIDLYQLHQPDPTTPIEHTLAALDDLVRAGKVREIGCSNFSAEDIGTAMEAARGARFVSVRNEYSLLHREPERGVLGECRRRGLAFIPFFPLASGLLTGKYTDGPPPKGARLSDAPKNDRFASDENLGRARELGAFARSRGRTLLELAVSWLLGRTTVASVIAGATRPEQVRANAAAAAGWHLTDEDLREIDRIAPVEAGSRRIAS
jgi:aryl-alcohol dehydrogenase-like predicted oxidoreductase